MKISKYKHNSDISYTLGITLTIELLKHKPDRVKMVFLHSSLTNGEGYSCIAKLAEEHSIPIEYNDKVFNILSQKENCFAIGVFEKFESPVNERENHILLVNPSNAGNMGTIIRAAAGFNMSNIVVIKPGTDIFDPKTVRASMGAVFSINFQYFDTFEEYKENFSKHSLYPFMLNAKSALECAQFKEPCTLIFGNEATGLPEYFSKEGTSLIISHSNKIDSLNLPVAASIAMYELTKGNF